MALGWRVRERTAMPWDVVFLSMSGRAGIAGVDARKDLAAGGAVVMAGWKMRNGLRRIHGTPPETPQEGEPP